MLRSTLKVLVATSILMVFTATAALAVSNAHFVGTPTATRNRRGVHQPGHPPSKGREQGSPRRWRRRSCAEWQG